MALDLWTHQFCLACDRQVQAATAAYCSESCRLADFEKSTSSSSSQASSPGLAEPSYPWSTTQTSPSKFYLSPAYDFSNPQAYGTTSKPARRSTHSAPMFHLSPSSSHSSLCSIRSSSSSTEASQLSEKTRKELQAYAGSFDQVRSQRRRSY